MEKKDSDFEQELCDQLQRLYEKFVPASEREYIDESSDDAPTPVKKQKEKMKPLTETQRPEVQ